MTQQIAKQKTLFTVPDTAETPPSLLTGLCSCGYLFFPPHRFGCEACGAGPEAISIIETTARGVLKAFALSHREAHPDGSTPYIIGQVVLDAGPAISVVLETRENSRLSIGQRVIGKLVPVKKNDKGQIIVDCLFAPEGKAQ